MTAWLFCPADRPDRYAKAAEVADVVILDLEDAVAPAARPAARSALVVSNLDPERTVVRVNPVGTPDHALDLQALAQTAFDRVMLAKSETVDQIRLLANYSVVALCETPAGVLQAPALAREPNVTALMWGAEDLVAAIGGRSSRFPDGRYRDVARLARSSVLLAAAAAGKSALDSVFLDLADLDGLAAEAADGVASGFAAKVCIHPVQVPVVRAAFAATEAQVAWARRVLATAQTERGVFSFEGQMVDEPVLRQARQILAG
jgi:citrate lyase subunit beta/citryl-CoA lyase